MGPGSRRKQKKIEKLTVFEFFELALESYHAILVSNKDESENENSKQRSEIKNGKKGKNCLLRKSESYGSLGKGKDCTSYSEIWKQKERHEKDGWNLGEGKEEGARSEIKESCGPVLGEINQRLIRLDRENLDIGRLAYEKMSKQHLVFEHQSQMTLVQETKSESKWHPGNNLPGKTVLVSQDLNFEMPEEAAQDHFENDKKTSQYLELKKREKMDLENEQESFQCSDCFGSCSPAGKCKGLVLEGKKSREVMTKIWGRLSDPNQEPEKEKDLEDQLLVQMIQPHLQKLVHSFVGDLCIDYASIAPNLETQMSQIQVIVVKKCFELLDALITNDEALWLSKIMVLRPSNQIYAHFRASVLTFKQLKAVHSLDPHSSAVHGSLMKLCNHIMRTPEMAKKCLKAH
jgi:hypothetical protein